MVSLPRFSSVVLLGTLLFGCGKKEEAVQPAPAITHFSVESVTPADGARVSRSSIINATLNYELGDNEATDATYRVVVLFNTNTSGSSTATGVNYVTLTDRKGSVNLSYGLGQIWDQPNLAHPISYRFSLQRMMTPSTSQVLAQSGIINCSE